MKANIDINFSSSLSGSKTIRALKAEVEEEAAPPSITAEDLGLTPLKKREKLRTGDKVVVCAGSQIGWEGEVVSVSLQCYAPSLCLRSP